ncbi:hypothetical protein ACIBF6_12405 [Streptosporangium amethystogenes]
MHESTAGSVPSRGLPDNRPRYTITGESPVEHGQAAPFSRDRDRD